MTTSHKRSKNLSKEGDPSEFVVREPSLQALENVVMVECSKVALQMGNFHDAASAIFNIAKRITGVQSGYVALLSGDGAENEVLFLDSGGLSCSVDPHLPMPVRSLRSEAYQSCQVVYENAFESSEWTKFLPQGHVHLENVLFAPLVINGKSAGVIGLANKHGGFNKDDVQIDGRLGEFAVIALVNSLKLQTLQESEARSSRTAEVNRTIAELGRIISSSFSIDQVYDRFASLLKGIIPFDWIRVRITKPEEGIYSIAHTSGIDIPGRRKGDTAPLTKFLGGGVPGMSSGQGARKSGRRLPL